MKIFLLLALFSLGCNSVIAPKVVNSHPKLGENIVSFGDSIARGLGVPPGQAFADLIAKTWGLTLVPKAIDGDTTRSSLARVDKDVIANKPAMVLITLGLNDPYQQIPFDETVSNLKSIFEKLHAAGALVVYFSMEPQNWAKKKIEEIKKLCEELGVLYIAEAFDFKDTKLLYDSEHPNYLGHQLIAERALPLIKRHYP